MITSEIQEEILQIRIGLSGQWDILFGVQERTFLTCNNLLAEEFCDLRPCLNMKPLPDSFGNLTNLQHRIHFCGDLANPNLLAEEFCALCPCLKMKPLPDSFGNLTNLQHRIHFCGNLANPNLLAEEFCDLCPCLNMKRLPDSFGNLTNLQDRIL